LPLYNQDDDSNPAEVVTRLKGKITAAHGVIFVTPEYNRSIPGVLKNAIDHASRPYGQSAWKGKPAGVLGASVGPSGTAMAQQHLRNVLAYLDMPTLAQPEAFIQASDSYFAGGESRTRPIASFYSAGLIGTQTGYANWQSQDRRAEARHCRSLGITRSGAEPRNPNPRNGRL
jgi:NAD(P)H-dependent FMN reductase